MTTTTTRKPWLNRLIAELGPAEAHPELDRWVWDDGELGVYAEQLTHVWQVVAWTPDRSVTLRSASAPTTADFDRVAGLAGLHQAPRLPAHAGLELPCTPCAGPCRVDRGRA